MQQGVGAAGEYQVVYPVQGQHFLIRQRTSAREKSTFAPNVPNFDESIIRSRCKDVRVCRRPFDRAYPARVPRKLELDRVAL